MFFCFMGMSNACTCLVQHIRMFVPHMLWMWVRYVHVFFSLADPIGHAADLYLLASVYSLFLSLSGHNICNSRSFRALEFHNSFQPITIRI